MQTTGHKQKTSQQRLSTLTVGSALPQLYKWDFFIRTSDIHWDFFSCGVVQSKYRHRHIGNRSIIGFGYYCGLRSAEPDRCNKFCVGKDEQVLCKFGDTLS